MNLPAALIGVIGDKLKVPQTVTLDGINLPAVKNAVVSMDPDQPLTLTVTFYISSVTTVEL